MKKVKLVGLMVGPNGAHHAGSVIELADAEAEHLIRTGQAEAVSEAVVTNSIEVPEKSVSPESLKVESGPTEGQQDAKQEGDSPSGDAPKANENSAEESAAVA